MYFKMKSNVPHKSQPKSFACSFQDRSNCVEIRCLRIFSAHNSPGLQGERGKGAQDQYLIPYLWKTKMVKTLCQTDSACQIFT